MIVEINYHLKARDHKHLVIHADKVILPRYTEDCESQFHIILSPDQNNIEDLKTRPGIHFEDGILIVDLEFYNPEITVR